MGVGLAFLRPREDGTWEGDYQLRGWGEFGDLQEAIFDRGGPGFPYFREDEYDVEIDDDPPPYPATVSESLARDLLAWIEYDRPRMLEALRSIPEEEELYGYFLKRMLQEYVKEGYAVLVSP